MKVFTTLWRDDGGVVAAEYLLVGTVVALGLVLGLANLEAALNAELSELSNGFLALSQGYAINNQFSCTAYRQGSQAFDTPDTVRFFITTITPISIFPSSVNILICP